jgi:hypothetical protein
MTRKQQMNLKNNGQSFRFQPESFLPYLCYICGKLDHTIYAYPHQTMAHVLFKIKVTTLIIEVELKEDALINMVLE